MLHKPVYAGWLVVKGWGERTRGDFEPLVNQEVFDCVQAVLSGRRISIMPRLRSHPDFPLRHFVNCGCCGSPLTGSYAKNWRKKRYPYYWCQNKNCQGKVRVSKMGLERGFVNFLSRKKSLEEQSSALLKGRADWLEPFQSWILTARNAGEIIINGSPQEKKVLAQKVFGSNLVLDCKKARGSCVKPWSLLLENSSHGGMVPPPGIELG